MTAHNFDLEHRKWINEQIRQALESDPANDIEVTTEYWERKYQELEAMISNRKEIATKLASGSTLSAKRLVHPEQVADFAKEVLDN